MNKAKLQELLLAYHEITGAELSILNSRFHTLATVGAEKDNYCAYLHRHESALSSCRASDIEHLCIASRTSAPVMYTCPFGVTELIVPVIRNDKPIAYLFSSIGVGEDLAEDVGTEYRDENDEMLNTLRSKLPIITSRKADAYLQILTVLAEHIGNDPTVTEESETVGELTKQFIKQNLSSKITLSDIAFHLHCSTVTVTENFKKEFGYTVVEYVTKKRIDLSINLLLSTDLSIGEIAELAGFSDVEYFSRSFKKFMGDSPSTWRKNNKQ